MDLKKKDERLKTGEALPLMEAYYTIQGEGYHKGSAVFFIRIGGCDIGCHWCDVKESWNPSIHPITDVKDIIDNAKNYSDTVIVTGGEPLMWNMFPLTDGLRSFGIKTHIETSGAYPLSGNWDWFCLSPKKNKLPTSSAYERADELKVIIHNKDDFNFADLQAKKVNIDCKLFLQPEWSRNKKMIPLIVDYIMKNPKWKVSLQTHKYLNIP